MHLEGPFIHPDKRGAHSAAIIRKPTDAELDEIIRYGKDVICLMTIAPEQFSEKQLDMLLDSGIQLSIGHTTIGYEQAKLYFNKGIRIVTHLFNAMTQFLHREPGLVGAALDTQHVFTPVILDGAHCHYASAKIAYALKKEKMILLSDAAFLGRKKQAFESPLLNAVLQDGYYRNKEGNLAGAAISMVEAVMNAEMYLGIPRAQALRMASSSVAAALNLEDQFGKIDKSYPASFCCFKDDWSEYKTMVF
jgi:N-acetylglucosamine-6-phosphate deacetylase